MPELTALLLAEQYRDRLLSSERQAATRLVNAYGAMYKRLTGQIDALTAELDVMAAKGEVSKWRAMRLESLHRLKAQVLSEVDRYAVLVEDAVDQGAKAAIAAASKDCPQIVQAALPGVERVDAAIMAGWQSLDPEAVQAALGFLSDDSPLKVGLREAYGKAIADGVEKGIVEGIGLGYNPRKVAAAFSRELGMGLVSALRTARTTQLMAYREATRAHYMANPDIVKGWVWRAARDKRTCMSCIAMDGTVHGPSERLNDHWNGRCTAVPKTVTYKELGLNAPEPPPTDEWLRSLSSEEEQRMLGKRYEAWKSGEVRFSETAQDWFKRQPEAVQRQMLGPGKHDAWREGKFKLEQLTTETSDPVWGAMRTETPLKALVD